MRRRIASAPAAMLLALLVPACASVPPPKGEVANADMAFRGAEVAQGTKYAPLETRMAREKLEAAHLAMKDGRNLAARRLAEEAKVDAQLAETKAQTAVRVRAAEEIQADIDAIREEAQRSSRIMRGTQ